MSFNKTPKIIAMKKILLLLVLFSIGFTSFSQEYKLYVSGLNSSEITSDLKIKKANLTQEQSGIYTFERRADSNSQNIVEATNQKKLFPSVFLTVEHRNGNKAVTKLVNVYFSAYSKSGRKEKFTIHFEEAKEEI